MTEQDRLAAIVEAPTLAGARRLVQSSPPGFEGTLFEALRSAAGANVHTARRIAGAGEAFDNGRDAWSHRFRAVARRFEQRWLASANEYLRAEAASPDPVEGAAMAVGAIDSLARAGRVAQAVALADRLSQTLERAGRSADAGRASLNAGNALLWHDRVEEATTHLERAAWLLADDPLEQAAAWLGLSTAQIDCGTARDVRQSAERAVQTFQELGADHYAALAEQNLAQADLMAGRLDDALDRLLKLRALFPRESEEYARNEQHLGETYLRLNMPVEARQAFRAALACAAMARLPYNQAQCHLGAAEAEFALDRADEGRDSAAQAERLFKRAGNRAGASLARVVAAHAVRDVRALAREVEELERHNLRRKTAEALFLIAEHDAHGPSLHRGRELVERHGLVDLEWRAHAASARTAPEHRLDAYRKMAGAMWETRSLHRSTVARQHFLRDKDHALREYLGVLLEEPTEDNVAEALGVLGQARSVSLIDEIIFARRGSFSAEQSSALHAIREEIREAIENDRPNNGARRTATADVSKWRRAWHEAAGRIFPNPHHRAVAQLDATFLQVRDGYYRLTAKVANRIGDRDEIDEETKWLNFELQAPLVGHANPDGLNAQLASLRDKLGLHASSPIVTVMPDEALWRAPWALLAPEGSEPLVCLAPGFSWVYRPTQPPRSVTVWYHEAAGLPHIQREVEAICRTFSDTRLCRTAAEARGSLESGETDILHIATHAALNAWNPMFSYLQFEDGAIFAAEIARGGLRPKLVTLSACDTGSVSGIESNEPDGLVRAALALGPDSVVASAWPLDDSAAALFSVPYYRALRDGASVTEAVSAGRSAVKEKFEHPYYWGSMVAFGGYLKT